MIYSLAKKAKQATAHKLPGCAAIAETEIEIMELIHEAIEFHLEDLREKSETILQIKCHYVEVPAA